MSAFDNHIIANILTSIDSIDDLTRISILSKKWYFVYQKLELVNLTLKFWNVNDVNPRIFWFLKRFQEGLMHNLHNVKIFCADDCCHALRWRRFNETPNGQMFNMGALVMCLCQINIRNLLLPPMILEIITTKLISVETLTIWRCRGPNDVKDYTIRTSLINKLFPNVKMLDSRKIILSVDMQLFQLKSLRASPRNDIGDYSLLFPNLKSIDVHVRSDNMGKRIIKKFLNIKTLKSAKIKISSAEQDRIDEIILSVNVEIEIDVDIENDCVRFGVYTEPPKIKWF